MLQVVIPSQFGMISCRFDESVSGVDGFGNVTDGAVVSLTLGGPVEADAKMHSGTCGFGGVARSNLLAWLGGDLDALLNIGVRQVGTDFRQDVWQAMRQIAPGEPVSYGVLAAMAGHEGAFRAAASTCANNKVALIVPCHRVIKADGSLGEYSIGENGRKVKAALLAHEARSA
jgi:methylated-DNA-[protein]-cysteine S-methyltransferase